MAYLGATAYSQTVAIHCETNSNLKYMKMNKVRIIGLIILIIGLITQFTIENNVTDFISAAFIGGGFTLLLVGKIEKPAI